MNVSQAPLVNQVTEILRPATENKPMHWSVLTDHFVKGNMCTNDELVTAVNSLLVPFGRLRGKDHRFWFT